MAARDALPTTFGDFANMGELCHTGAYSFADLPDTNRVTGRGSLGKRIMGLKVEVSLCRSFYVYPHQVVCATSSPIQLACAIVLWFSAARNLPGDTGTICVSKPLLCWDFEWVWWPLIFVVQPSHSSGLLRAPFPICTIGVLGSVFAGGKMMTSPVGKSIFDKATHTRVVSL